MTTDNTDREGLEPCPFCPDGGESYLHDTQFGTRAHDVAVRCRKCGASAGSHSWASGLTYLQDERYAEAKRKAVIAWNTRSRAAVAAPRRYFCSCGGALTADEYIVHYFEMGHDRGEQPRNSAREKLDAIIVRCTDGDLSHDWRAVIGRLAREALASLPPVALIPEQEDRK